MKPVHVKSNKYTDFGVENLNGEEIDGTIYEKEFNSRTDKKGIFI